jgi:hypothetical protein
MASALTRHNGFVQRALILYVQKPKKEDRKILAVLFTSG